MGNLWIVAVGWLWEIVEHCVAASIMLQTRPRPANDILIEFEIQWNFVMRFIIICAPDHNEILHISRQ